MQNGKFIRISAHVFKFTTVRIQIKLNLKINEQLMKTPHKTEALEASRLSSSYGSEGGSDEESGYRPPS